MMVAYIWPWKNGNLRVASVWRNTLPDVESAYIRFLWYKSEFFHFLLFLVSESPSFVSTSEISSEKYNYVESYLRSRHNKKVYHQYATAAEKRKICEVRDVSSCERCQWWHAQGYDYQRRRDWRRLHEQHS